MMVDGWSMDGWSIGGWIDGWIDGSGWIDDGGWMSGWINNWMNRWKKVDWWADGVLIEAGWCMNGQLKGVMFG